MDALFSTLWVSFILYLFYETDAVYKYLRLFRMFLPERVTRMLEYDWNKWEANGVSYSTFMQTQHPSFLLDMVICRYCLGAWLALATVPICGIMWTPVVYFGSQLFLSMFTAAERKLQLLREAQDG